MIDQEPKKFDCGTDLPYQVPADFFDKLPELTLKRAKERAEKRRRNSKVVRLFVLMSSAAAVLLVILLTSQRELKQEQPMAMLPIEHAEVKKEVDVKATIKSTQTTSKAETTTSTTPPIDEDLDEILESLSDEDLTLLTAMYSGEALEDEIVQETININ